MSYDKVRVRIIGLIERNYTREFTGILVDQILADPDILIRSDKQILPPFDYEKYLISYTDYLWVQKGMIEAGFIKCEKKEA